jgi:hypothetical protein
MLNSAPRDYIWILGAHLQAPGFPRSSTISPCVLIVTGSSTIAEMVEENKLGVSIKSVTPKKSCFHLHPYPAQALPPLEVY